MLPIGPVWSAFHIALKFPGITAVAVLGTVTYTHLPTTPNIQTATSTIPTSGAMIALTFDDGWASVYDTALPMMAERSMVGTNYLHTRPILEANPPGYINPEQVMAFVDAGWEVGSHSMYHADLTELLSEDLEYTMTESYAHLVEWTGLEDFPFSSPLGEFNESVVRFSEVNYTSHVNAWSDVEGVNTLDNFDMFNIHRWDTKHMTVAEVCENVNNLEDDEFYVVIFHQIDDNGGEYSLTPNNFGAILDCVGAVDASVVTVSDGAESMLRRLGY